MKGNWTSGASLFGRKLVAVSLANPVSKAVVYMLFGTELAIVSLANLASVVVVERN